MFSKIYEVHLASRRMKEWNRTAYYTLKYSVSVAVLGLIIASAFR